MRNETMVRPPTGATAMTALVVAWLLGGCALHQAADREIGDMIARYERDRLAQAESYGRPPDAPADRGPTPRPSTAPTRPPEHEALPGTLAGLIAQALERNPDIAAAVETAAAKAKRVPQETSLPDPMLSTKTMPRPLQLADGSQYFVLGVDQTLPSPAKLERRGRMALEETRMAVYEAERVRQRVIADVKRMYHQLFAIDRTIAITQENQELVRGLIEVAQGQLAAGRRPQEDALRAQVEYANLETELIQLRQQRASAQAMMNALLDRPAATAVPSPAAYDIRRLEPRLDVLLNRALESNPELAALQRQIERDRYGVDLARLAYWPDFFVGAEWMMMEPRKAFVPARDPTTGNRPDVDRSSEMGGDMWALNAGLSLPIWIERIEAGIREARHRLSATRRQYAAARNTIAYRVQDAAARVTSQRRLAELFASTIVPQARQTYEVSQAGYVAGTTDFQFVIDNWQKWLMFQVQYYRALAELERSVADLEEAVGVSVVEAAR